MATHAPSFGAIDLPRPGRAALPLLALALLALCLEADPVLRIAGGAAAACFVLAAAVRAGQAKGELGAVRRTADRVILAATPGVEGSDVVRWRTLELVAPVTRHGLAREIERTLQRVDPGRLPSASPLRRGIARSQRDMLERLEERMLDDRPVTARGILLLRRLLRDPGSPLYDDQAPDLGRTIARVLVELEP